MQLNQEVPPRLTAHASLAITLLCGSAWLGSGAAAQTPPNEAGQAWGSISPLPNTSTLPEGWQHGAFMEVFVRGYKDSNGDGIGDLRGLTQQLDYLRDLGIKGLWLMPITASADHDHGYATTDFRALEPDYGSLDDLDELLRQAHARGIGVIMDYVLNHSAASHPLFQQSAQGAGNRWRSWYVWREPGQQADLKQWDIWGKNPWYQQLTDANSDDGSRYFATFGAAMPDFNLRLPEVQEFHRSSLRFWLNRGLDGFRLDAVPHLIENDAEHWNDQPESRQLTGEFSALIRSYPGRHVVCEATANPSAYAAAEVCGSAFAFGHEGRIIKAARGDRQAVADVAHFFETAPLSLATMLSNHDIFAGQRAWDQFHGDEAAYKLAAATYLLQPGTPFIYYGEEIGMAGVPGLAGDAPLRTPMSWRAPSRDPQAGFSKAAPYRPISPNAASHNVEREAGNPRSLLNFYKAMLKLRNTLPEIASGSYEQVRVDGLMTSFKRCQGAHCSIVAINYGRQAATLRLDASAGSPQLQQRYPREGQVLPTARNAGAARPAALRIKMAPRSVQVWRETSHINTQP
ncbi:alpha-amylase family glycosyl hydrolase [Paucibacter sp. APW11]|uniref:Alpha-amylase family glycosyl hydrolase n=1 Tax=Roseateles aquae TaxID=3077235 RepID=A0ABU3P6Q4_9BURK|nr:alpha-amylase family glycosyl hydrolase [Paucibacter sp. APW11]MDT8998262.1 alpha-amylase family glycosyl hydrolase [Paucibacter sp. APW11]